MPSPSVWFGMLTQAQKEEVLKRAAEEASARFDRYVETLRNAVGLRTLSAAERLEAYRTREPQIWSLIQARFPDEYARMMRDWKGLEAREARKVPYNPLAMATSTTSQRAVASIAQAPTPSY